MASSKRMETVLLRKRSLEVAPERAERSVGRRGPRDDEETKAPAGERVVKNRRETAADRIPNHSFSDGLPDRYADDRRAIGGQGICPVDGQGAGRDAPAALPQPVEIGCATQTGIPAH